MADKRLQDIISYIEEIQFVKITSPFELHNLFVNGKISITIDELDNPLEFSVEIAPQYPFKSYESESIKFKNTDLLDYNHVMGDGTICIHTSHSSKLKDKIKIDFLSLKNWILKYYVNKDDDKHYEHLIVPDLPLNNYYYSIVFTNVDYTFNKGQYGLVKLSQINNGKRDEKVVSNFITQAFADENGKEFAECNWSLNYKNSANNTQGIFLFLEDSPSKHNRFILQDWSEFSNLFQQDFLNFLHRTEEMYIAKKSRGKYLPFFIGYKIPNGEVHWQVAMIEIGNFPIYGEKGSNGWYSVLSDGKINWAKTRNISYHYFFGRGTFCETLTKKRTLILGIGAIGSMVAKTMVKCGIKQIDLADYDLKEPENIPRAEYHFFTGVTEKTQELGDNLSLISPFIEVGHVNQKYFEYLSKILHNDYKARNDLTEFLNSYDLIFDCTTDNDLMFILNSLAIKSDLINISITNHAKDLVCAFHPNIYNFVIGQFQEVLDNDIEDLYNPIGCWSPTFKASYNDIAVLVQHALKQINLIYQKNLLKSNFILKTNNDEGFNIKLEQF